jgi:transposase
MAFIRKKVRKNSTYLYLVSNSWIKGKVKQKVIAYLGKEENLPKILLDSIKMKKFFDSDIENLSYQAPLVLWNLAQELGITKIFSDNLRKKAWGVPASVASTMMMLNYTLESRSKDKLSRWYEQTYLKYIAHVHPSKLNSDLLYRTLDFFSEEKIEKIHEEIFKRAKEKFNLSDKITFYDVTAILFEGNHCNLAKKGYNAEALYKLQANLGLAVTNERFPVAHKTFEGNIKDVTTFDKIIALLARTMDLRNTIFIFDRGIFSEENKQKILSHGSKYISGLRKYPEINSFINSAKEEDFKKADEKTLYYEVATEERKILYWNKEMALEQRKERENKLDKIEEKLKKLDPSKYEEKRLYEKVGEITGKYRKYFEINYEKFSVKRNEKEIENAKQMDGKSVLTTNTDLNADTILKRYRDKNFIEMSFKDLKMFVDIRPIRHWKDNRVLTHIFLAVLAFGLRSLLELRLRRAGFEITAQEALEQLGKVRALCADKQIIKVTGEDEKTKRIMELFALKG